MTPAQAAIVYANEADLLNVALFGQTAKQWRDANPKLDGNMRDHAAIEQLLVLANLEGMNAELIHMGLSQGDAEAAQRDRHPPDANPHRQPRRPPARPTGGGKRMNPRSSSPVPGPWKCGMPAMTRE